MYDLVVIGGGINGVGVARDAAGRGLKVLLCEKDDFASHTSSSSSKLIHGGLRYLEHYEFRLVRESLKERETLLRISPHVIWPMRIVLPVLEGMRPTWLIRLGLFLYDNLVRRSVLPGTAKLKLRNVLQGKPLQERLKTGFEYSDCWADDARLVVLNAVDAKQRGADVRNYCECTALERGAEHWDITLTGPDRTKEHVQSKMVVNAAGPWVDEVAHLGGHFSNSAGVRLVKGSHIVTDQLYEGDHGYIFQSADGRVIFAMPYEKKYTLIGTTDIEMQSVHDAVEISNDEIEYLCSAVNEYFKAQISKADVIWDYAGVRPLFDDQAASASVVTRDYVFDLADGEGKSAPLLSIYGGKLTTFRKLAEHAIEKIADLFPDMDSKWTHEVPLPGGGFSFEDKPEKLAQLQSDYPWLDEAQAARLLNSYGILAWDILGSAKCSGDLGEHFGGGLYEAELRHLRDVEFATNAMDVLWRRSKLGLHVTSDCSEKIDTWFASQ